MAQIGFVNFSAGDVLTEAQLDGMMRQTVMSFANATARNTALSGVLDEGMIAYLEDINSLTFYDGSSWAFLSSPWVAYTPSLSGASIGNGSLEFRYQYTGVSSVRVRGALTFGTTTSVSGQIGFGLPGALVADGVPRNMGWCWYEDATGTDATGMCIVTTSIFTYSTAAAVTSATVPFTWATSDVLNVDVTFEVA